MSLIPATDLILNRDGSVYHLSLLPKHVSDTVIVVGDPNRVFRVSQYFDEISYEINQREFITHVGRFNGKKITVISSGIGTDNVEILFTELDALVNVDLKTREPKTKRKKLKIIRIGTSGALQQDIPVGTHLVSDYAVGLDNLMNFYSFEADEDGTKLASDIKEKLGLAFRPYVGRGSKNLMATVAFDMVKGNTVTAPGFYAPQGRTVRLPIRYPSLLSALNQYHYKKLDFWFTNFEMETAGYYALGALLGHEVLSVNAIIANRIADTFSPQPNKIIDALILKVLERI